jgi:hypothetical protein
MGKPRVYYGEFCELLDNVACLDDFCRRARVNRKHLWDIRLGTYRPKYKTRLRMARILKVPLAVLDAALGIED